MSEKHQEQTSAAVEAELVERMGATGDTAPVDVAEIEEVQY